jgi:predicted amidohydrolase YtcJ
MLADIAVLSQDIFTVPTPAIPATHSVLTIVDGRIAYDELTRGGRRTAGR